MIAIRDSARQLMATKRLLVSSIRAGTVLFMIDVCHRGNTRKTPARTMDSPKKMMYRRETPAIKHMPRRMGIKTSEVPKSG
jgi:hypothetical protein